MFVYPAVFLGFPWEPCLSVVSQHITFHQSVVFVSNDLVMTWRRKMGHSLTKCRTVWQKMFFQTKLKVKKQKFKKSKTLTKNKTHKKHKWSGDMNRRLRHPQKTTDIQQFTDTEPRKNRDFKDTGVVKQVWNKTHVRHNQTKGKTKLNTGSNQGKKNTQGNTSED